MVSLFISHYILHIQFFPSAILLYLINAFAYIYLYIARLDNYEKNAQLLSLSFLSAHALKIQCLCKNARDNKRTRSMLHGASRLMKKFVQQIFKKGCEVRTEKLGIFKFHLI